jgi:hypothetical protein
MFSLSVSGLHIRHSSALLQQLLICGQRGQNIRLAERQPDLAVLLIVTDD